MFILGMTRENASGDQDGRSGWIYYVPAHRKLAEATQLGSKLYAPGKLNDGELRFLMAKMQEAPGGNA